MRFVLYSLVSGMLVFAVARAGPAQTPLAATAEYLAPPVPVAAPPASAPDTAAGKDLGTTLAEIEKLRTQQAALQARAQDDDLKKKVEILEKQIETLEKLVKLLAEQVKKQAAAAAAGRHAGGADRASGPPGRPAGRCHR